MPMKRPAAESNSNEKTNESSDLVLQQGNDAKRAKLFSISNTTLQDLPIEMVECILVRAVAKEVKDMRLAKCAWKEKADLVMNRLKTVCSQWNNILSTKFFRNEVHRILDRFDQETIRLEILHQFTIPLCIMAVATMKEEIFLLCLPIGQLNGLDHCVINVWERSNLEVVKDVIPLIGIQPLWAMEACSVSNCLYVGQLNEESQVYSVLRIARDEGHQFKISTWITDLQLSMPNLSISAEGRLIIASSPEEPNAHAVTIYGANGALQHTIILPRDVYGFKRFANAIQKPNGNVVMISAGSHPNAQLLEFGLGGNLVRQYQLGPEFVTEANFADVYGRIWTMDWFNTIEVFDSELNPLGSSGPKLNDGAFVFMSKVHYSSESSELLRSNYSVTHKKTTLTIYRLTDK